MITEAVKNIFESYDNKRYERFKLDLADVDMFDNPELEDYFADAELPNSVDVSLTVIEEPSYEGDYNNAPYGGGIEYVDCEVDIDGSFKKELPQSLYNIFVDEITNYLKSNYENIIDGMVNDDYDPYEYEPDDMW
jgi:hypothetical protein